MKSLTIFTAALMFLLSFADLCDDGATLLSANTSTIEQGCGDHDEGGSATCSPFCNCSRCSFSVLIPKHRISESLITIYRDFPAPHASSDLPLSVSTAVWQPPKSIPLAL